MVLVLSFYDAIIIELNAEVSRLSSNSREYWFNFGESNQQNTTIEQIYLANKQTSEIAFHNIALALGLG